MDADQSKLRFRIRLNFGWWSGVFLYAMSVRNPLGGWTPKENPTNLKIVKEKRGGGGEEEEIVKSYAVIYQI